MSYSLSISLALGISKAGLSLRSQLINTLGAALGFEINSGFVEIGNGYYMWTYDFPDNFQGGVKFYPNGQLSNVLAFLTLNPQEAENVDMKISEISAGSGNDVNIEVGHSNARGFFTLDDTSGVDSNISVVTGTDSGGSPNISITTGTQSNSANIGVNDEGTDENTSNRIVVNTGVR